MTYCLSILYIYIVYILGDPGAAIRDDAIFLGDSLFQALEVNVRFRPTLSHENIASSRLAARGSPKIHCVLHCYALIHYLYLTPEKKKNK